MKRVGLLLFGSGFCALVYQVAWTREFRLIFGASTAASAAVLAIFIGGLGAGSILLGPRADQKARPLHFYAQLELLISIAAALSPLLLWLVRAIYLALGGTTVLGTIGGTALRLVLSALVLGPPTLLMGGTLPAAVRSVETDDDLGRKRVATLYGANTLGAVVGATASTFVLLEVLGTRRMLWAATLVNLVVAVTARSLSRAMPEQKPALAAAAAGPPAKARRFVLAAAGAVGFAFFLMELVWYRMLGPLLGGTVFTFGLILATALLGIGIGGAIYGRFVRGRPTLAAFAMTALVEALLVALPLALGDRIAVLALLLRPLGVVGFGGFVASWTVITTLVVLPVAIVAGIQFPLLIALLGSAREEVGRHIGLAYAANTGGAILGALAGGFGLLPLLSATGCWRVVAILLVALGLVALVLELDLRRTVTPGTIAIAAVVLALAPGPTAAWRHSSIGTGRIDASKIRSRNSLHDWRNQIRAAIRWDKDGLESSVALDAASGWAFVLNGKIDGNAIGDAATQVMGGMLGAILLPEPPKRAMVIGLGTGSTAGWLGAIPGMERVDTVELERAVLHVAEVCTPVNHDVLHNPRVHIQIADAREVLLTTREKYDLVFSEPSNPYRAGVASLFTREYYRAIADRLQPGGVFLQWVQGYEVDARTVRSIYATLAQVFPNVETWELGNKDMLLVASQKPIAYDAARLRQRISEEPYHHALLYGWRVTDLEGFLAHYVAQPGLATRIAEQEAGEISTDDRTLVEFGFAHAIGSETRFDLANVRAVARLRKEDRPAIEGDVDWTRVEDQRLAILAASGAPPQIAHVQGPQQHRATALFAYARGDSRTAVAEWNAQPLAPSRPDEITVVAEALADSGSEAALPLIEQLRPEHPTDADAISARLLLRQNKLPEAAQAMQSALLRYRSDPWPFPPTMVHTLNMADELVRRDRSLGEPLLQTLSQPFAVMANEDNRQLAIFAVARHLRSVAACSLALPVFEPHVPWRFEFLLWRRDCYKTLGDPRFEQADHDLDEFASSQPAPFSVGLLPDDGK